MLFFRFWSSTLRQGDRLIFGHFVAKHISAWQRGKVHVKTLCGSTVLHGEAVATESLLVHRDALHDAAFEAAGAGLLVVAVDSDSNGLFHGVVPFCEVLQLHVARVFLSGHAALSR